MNRIERLQQQLTGEGLDAFLVRETPNIAYLTGFEGVFDDERAHALLVQDGRAILHTDSRYANACKQAAETGGSLVQIDDEAVPYAEWLAKCITQGTLGIEDSISLAEFHKLEEAMAESVQLRETKAVVSKLRQVKDAAELGHMRAAQAITDAAFSHIVTVMKPGMTEREVAHELDNFMFAQGADALAFPTIVATGPNAANPHAQPGETALEAGQCVVMDFGARVAGYCSDMTRTVFLGEPNEKLARAYAALREANETVEAMLKPGITGAAAHQKALDVLEEAGFGGTMGHGLGHSLGLEIHEDPVLSPRYQEALQAGNVLTVEPGIYIPGEFGMRLEDFGVLTESGFEVFTQSTHDLVLV